MKTPRLRIPLVMLAIAVAVALVEAAGLVIRTALDGRSFSWPVALGAGFALWLSMVAATPIPIWMAARFPFERGVVARRLVLHIAAAVLFVTVHLVLDIAAQTSLGNMRREPFWPHLVNMLSQYLAIEALVYAAVAGAFMFVRAHREAEARALAAEALRAQLEEARLAALHSQLAPHFLFNTLNAISTLALKGQGEAVTRALSTLADLLRFVLDKDGGPEIQLVDELTFVDRYLELQQLRFADRLVVEHRVEAGVLQAAVPRLLLQPIVENAVRHGLEDTGGGQVTLAARRDGAELVLEISDRGLACRSLGQAGPVSASASALAPAPQLAPSGIGLKNTRARLEELYGKAQSLELLPSEAGTTVCIRLPYRPAPGSTTP